MNKVLSLSLFGIFVLFASVAYGQSDEEDSLYLYKAALKGETTRPGLDTMRMYIEKHPFATTPPGKTLEVLDYNLGYVYTLPDVSTNDWINHYNWLAKIQQLNSEEPYQKRVIMSLAYCLQYMDDWNAAANMWYNYGLLFKDSLAQYASWTHLSHTRDYQKNTLHQDTTEFKQLLFPLDALLSVPLSCPLQPKIVFYPNPARSVTILDMELPNREYMVIAIMDVRGRKIRTIASDVFEAGGHSLAVPLGDLNSGTYYIRLESSSDAITKKLIVE